VIRVLLGLESLEDLCNIVLDGFDAAFTRLLWPFVLILVNSDVEILRKQVVICSNV